MAFDDFKNKHKKCAEVVMLLICKIIHFLKVYSIFDTLRYIKNAEKGSLRQNKRCKKCTVFTFASSNLSVLFSIRNSYIYELKQRFVSLKAFVGFSIVNSVTILKV